MDGRFAKLFAPIRGAALSFVRYPASMGFALALTGLTAYMIHETPAAYEKLLFSLGFAFAFGVVLGMALTVAAGKCTPYRMFFRSANILTPVMSAGVFFALYLPKSQALSDIASMRVIAAMAVSFLLFLVLPALGKKAIDFYTMVFLAIKSFFISAVYSLILMLGFFFVAFAVESLIYENLTEKTYLYIAIVCGLIGYAFFLGYFPSFAEQEESAESFETAIRQPKFAKVLFRNILIPILAALTIVLLIWSIRILFTGLWPDYRQVTGIFTAYSLFSILLYFLAGDPDTLLVRLFRRVIPIALLVFLAFEAYTVADRIGLYGVKTQEYGLVMVMFFSAVTAVLFLVFAGQRKYLPAFVAIGLITIYVLPGIGAADFSLKSQDRHLKRILTQYQMLDGDRIVHAQTVPLQDRIRITLAADYLGYDADFQEVFGFDRVYEHSQDEIPGEIAKRIYFVRDPGVLNMAGYSSYISWDLLTKNMAAWITPRGEYKLEYRLGNPQEKNAEGAYPSLVLALDESQIAIVRFNSLAESLITRYPAGHYDDKGSGSFLAIPHEELQISVETDLVKILLVFRGADIDLSDPSQSGFDLEGVYFSEK